MECFQEEELGKEWVTLVSMGRHPETWDVETVHAAPSPSNVRLHPLLYSCEGRYIIILFKMPVIGLNSFRIRWTVKAQK